MKVIYVNARIYDFTSATLIEGLRNLGHTLLCSEASNYGSAVAPDTLIAEAPSADLVVLGSNLGANVGLFVRNLFDVKAQQGINALSELYGGPAWVALASGRTIGASLNVPF